MDDPQDSKKIGPLEFEAPPLKEIHDQRVADLAQASSGIPLDIEPTHESVPVSVPERTTGFRLRAVYHLAALGLSPLEIERQINIPTARIKRMLSGPTAKMEVARLQDALFMRDSKKVFMAMLPKATTTVFKLMKDKNEKGSTRLEAAKTLMDRALGKPLQQIEQTGNGIKELYEQLDDLNRRMAAQDVPSSPAPSRFDPGEVVVQNEVETAQGTRINREEDTDLVLDDIDRLLTGK